MSGKDERFNMNYGTLALLTGWIVTFVVFCLGLTVVNVLSSGDQSSGWSLLPAALMFGFPVGAVTAALLLYGPSDITPEKLAVIAGVAASAAIGRASVVTMVARSNA